MPVKNAAWPDASGALNNIAAVSAEGMTVCVLMRRLRRTGDVFFLGYENNIGNVYLVFCTNNKLSYGVACRTLSFQNYFPFTNAASAAKQAQLRETIERFNGERTMCPSS